MPHLTPLASKVCTPSTYQTRDILNAIECGCQWLHTILHIKSFHASYVPTSRVQVITKKLIKGGNLAIVPKHAPNSISSCQGCSWQFGCYTTRMMSSSWLQLRIRRPDLGTSVAGAQKFPRLDPLLLWHGSGAMRGRWGVKQPTSTMKRRNTEWSIGLAAPGLQLMFAQVLFPR